MEVKRDVRDADAHALLAQLPAHFVVVADRLSPGAKDLLEHHHAGWFDRRGDLRVELPAAGLLLKTPVASVVAPERGRVANPFTPTGLDVAITMLLKPSEPMAVREIARRTGNSHGRVSEIIASFGIGDSSIATARPQSPTSSTRPPRRGGRTGCPSARGLIPIPRSGSRGPSGRCGEALRSSSREVAAGSLRPDELALRRLVVSYPPDTAYSIAPPARAAVCPSPFGFDQPRDLNPDFPVANYLVVALDLAQDQGRVVRCSRPGDPNGSPVPGEVRLADESGMATRLVTALAELTEHVEAGTFAVVGGLAVMARFARCTGPPRTLTA